MNRLIRHLIALLMIPAFVVDPTLDVVASLSSSLSHDAKRTAPGGDRGEAGVFSDQALANVLPEFSKPAISKTAPAEVAGKPAALTGRIPSFAVRFKTRFGDQ